jgi:hypothetical protein
MPFDTGVSKMAEGVNFAPPAPDCFDCWRQSTPWEHTEMRDDKLLLFADRLPKGVYEFNYMVKVTAAGEFRHPPARAFEMYFPEVMGRTRGEVIRVSNRE